MFANALVWTQPLQTKQACGSMTAKSVQLVRSTLCDHGTGTPSLLRLNLFAFKLQKYCNGKCSLISHVGVVLGAPGGIVTSNSVM